MKTKSTSFPIDSCHWRDTSSTYFQNYDIFNKNQLVFESGKYFYFTLRVLLQFFILVSLMNSEYRLNSVHSTPRIQQPLGSLNPPEYAAAGDAPRGQISRDLNLGTPRQTLAMDTSLLFTSIKNADTNSKSKFNDSCTRPNDGRGFNLPNEPPQNILSVIDKKSSSTRCGSSSRQCKIKEHSDYYGSLAKEPPSKECAHDTTTSNNYKNLSENEPKNSPKNIGPSKEIGMRNFTEDHSVDNILSPNRNVSMFSAEIWTEKVLPIDTFVCPEPELVEIYFDNKKETGELNRFRDYSAESIDVSATWKCNSPGVLGRNNLLSPPLSGRKSRTSSSGQKTVNFDDEIWPVCPKLIPSGKELSDLSIFGNRCEAIPPEKLNKNGEEIAAAFQPRTILLKSASIFGVSPRAGANQYDPEDSAKSERAIEPTHETEGLIDFGSIRSQAEHFCLNTLRTPTSQASTSAVEELPSFHCVDRISREKSLSQIGDTDCQKIPRTTERLKNVCSSLQETSTSEKDPLPTSKSESAGKMLGNAQNRRVDSLYGTEFPVTSCEEIHSWKKIGVKRKREGLGTTSSAPCREINFSPVENNDFIHDRFGNSVLTPTDIICAGSCEGGDLSKPSKLNSQPKIRENSVESAYRNRGVGQKICFQESRVKSSDSKSSSELPATELSKAHESIVKQKTKRNLKCVKMVRFETCGGHSSVKIEGSDTKLQTEKLEERNIDAYQSKMHLQLPGGNMGHTPDSMSVESFKQGIDQLGGQSTKQFEGDPNSDDAVEALAKIELIVEANRQATERLQKLQPHVAIPRLIPRDAGKSIARALMRCRYYMQTNGYSRDATSILNKLLMSTVMSLKQLVDRQKLALAQEKRQAISESRRQPKRILLANSSNSIRGLTTDDLVGNQVAFLIADILKVTKTIVPKLNGKETQKKPSVVPNCSNNSVTNVTRNIGTPMDTTGSRTGTTILMEDSKGTIEAYENKVTQLSVAQPNKVKEGVRNCSEKPTLTSPFEHVSDRIRGNHRVDKDSSMAASTYPKKISSTDPARTLKKPVNELWEKRSKPSPRYSTANDSTNNSHSLAGPNNAPINHKLPVWKPGGSNFNHPSMSAITNNQKNRPVLTSSGSRKKNTTIENLRNKKLHPRTKALPDITKDPSKIIEKSITKPHHTASQAKIRTFIAKRHHSEVSLDKSKVQVTSEIDATRSRKPRSKSRTRTQTPNKITRLTVTEIPLEHAEDNPTPIEEKIPAAKELPLSRKASSSPKDIILMLEELIKASGNETSIPNAHLVNLDAPCEAAVRDINEETDGIASTISEVKPMNLTDLIPASRKNDQTTHQNQSMQIISARGITKKSNSNVEIDSKEDFCNEQTPSSPDTVAEPNNVYPEFRSTVASNAEEVFAGARSDIETQISSDGSMGIQSTPSLSIFGCIAEASSELSIGSVSSKCCQASLTSSTSHDISEEFISRQKLDSGVHPFCEKSQENSNESLGSTNDGKVTRNDFAQQFQDDQSTSTSGDTTMKKKFVNKHAKSLEMLREILSDQGLGIHLLSRAENEVRDRWKTGSNQKGLIARRSPQGANLTTRRVERNDSTTLFGRLDTLSESGNNLKHAEVATITSGNNLTHCNKVDKALLSEVITVENATQFEITSESDMCVGDSIICESSAPSVLQCKKMSGVKISTVHSSPANFQSAKLTYESPNVVESKSMEYRLPDDILNAFNLAADRASNLYAAVNMLKGNMGSERTDQSKLAQNVDFNEMARHVPTTKPLTFAIDKATDVGRSSEVSNILQKSEHRNTGSPTTVITPRILEKVDTKAKFKEPMKKTSWDSARNGITGRSVTSVKEANEHTTCDTSQNVYHPNGGHRIKPPLPPKPLCADRKAICSTVENKIFQEEPSTDPTPAVTLKKKSSNTTKVSGGIIHPSLPSEQQRVVERPVTGKRVEILHFATRHTASVVRSTSNIGSEDIIVQSHSNEQSNSSLRSSEVEGKNDYVFTGSRIRTLLQKNLQRFETEYDPIFDEKVFKVFQDRLLPESIDVDVLVNKVFPKTTTAISCPDLDDCNILSEVKNLINCLLNGVEEHSQSAALATVYNPNPQLSRYRRIRKPVRKLKPERTRRDVRYGKQPILSEKCWSISSRIIVSREHLLPLVYAVICSFVFCCLQFSVHCEV